MKNILAATFVLPVLATSVLGMGKAQAFTTNTTVPEQSELNNGLSSNLEENLLAWEHTQGCYFDSYGNMHCW